MIIREISGLIRVIRRHTMHIIIDTRENTEKIIEILGCNKQVDFEVNQLKHGDFILNNSIIFERKTLQDFVLSIKDGRLFRQAYKTINKNQAYILILEGTKKDVEHVKMSREAIQGALVHLSVFLGIPILRSKNMEETLELIIKAGKQAEKCDVISYRRAYINHQKARKNNINKLQVQVLQNLSGIGKQRAIELLKSFGSLKKVFNATETELLDVPGIGSKTAKAIHYLVNKHK